MQDNFDLTIGRLDRVLSLLVCWGKDRELDLPNRQTLKHHAEDMIAAGEKILCDLGKSVQELPQPGTAPEAGIPPGPKRELVISDLLVCIENDSPVTWVSKEKEIHFESSQPFKFFKVIKE
jgi:hypothetical protein